ncbi:MAG: hypothetical protein WC724_03780 [Candidatus Paceibacterota bacterium]
MLQHKNVMEMEARKNKLLVEIEPLKKEKEELIATIKKLNNEVFVHRKDYDKVTKDRIEVCDVLDEKKLSLEERNDFLNKNNVEQSSRLNTLETLNKKLEEAIKEREDEEKFIISEIEIQKSLLKTLKISKEKEENEKRIELRQLIEELAKSKEELHKVKKETAEEKDHILEENRLLNIRRTDMEIYESRMRKKYPNEIFILQ